MNKKDDIELNKDIEENDKANESSNEDITNESSNEVSVIENQSTDLENNTDDIIIKIGKDDAKANHINKFDVFWLKVWSVICAFISQVSIYINKGIKFIFRKPAPLKYVKTVVASLLIILMVFIITAPFKITVNKKEELDIYSNGLIVVQRRVGTDEFSTNEDNGIYKYGYADKKGKIKIPCQYEDAMPFKYGVAWVLEKTRTQDGVTKYWKLIKKNGKQVEGGIPEGVMQGDIIPVSQFGDEVKYASVNIGGKFGFINTNGKIEIDCKYDEVGNFDYKLARVKIGSECYFINKHGKIVSEKYLDARDYQEGLAAVSNNGLWGFVDENGKMVIDVDYQSVSDFKQGYALVSRGDTYGIIDTKGSPVVRLGMFTDLELRKFFEE